jgi:putative SOS response-associated peptidase YedK
VCGRYTLTVERSVLAREFHLYPSDLKRWVSHYNIAPLMPIPVLFKEEELKFELFRWGLIPSWAKNEEMGERMINARKETLAEKPSFRESFNKRRCLILADGFYEWKKAQGRKIPYYVRLRSRGPFSFAGLWSQWASPEGEDIRSCAIITGEPNELLAPIHDRMPVILPPSFRERWLNPSNHDLDELGSLLKPYPSDEMEAYQVSDLVNSPAHDSPECLVPLN